jgi:Protein of unknown function (DUF2798)
MDAGVAGRRRSFSVRACETARPAIIQSGMTSAIASAIAFFRVATEASLISEWVTSWLAAWATMVPIVLLAAPAIRSIANALTSEVK